MFEHSNYPLLERRDQIFRRLSALDRLRSQADYNTGSISAGSAWALFALSHYFQPRLVAEVGTFIGRSALAVGLAQTEQGEGCEIHTCDKSNAIDLPPLEKGRIVAYPKTGSSEMFAKLLQGGLARKVQMVHLDGKLVPEDAALITELCAPEAIIALDDFEAAEKGVTQSSVFDEN